MDPATIALLVKMIDLAAIGISAGMTYAEARQKNAALFNELEQARSKTILGEPLSAMDISRLSNLIFEAQQARKAARAAVPVPE